MMHEAETVTLSMRTLSGEPGPISVIPRKIGSVRLIKEVGKGGMGVVWLGRDDFLGRDIAVKFLLSAIQSQEDPGFVTFLEGARAAAAVHATGLLTVYAADVIDAVPYIVMEFVDGPTVSRVVRVTGALSLPAALGVLETVCSAVAALHDHGIIHRDIKPANLLLDRDANVFVTDFGLACPRPTGMVGKVSEGVAGTPYYMAPEMFEGNVSVRTDVYALGVATYELLTGDVPFSGTLEIIREGHQKHALPMELLTERQVPSPVVEVIERATHKNFLFRYKTARHFLNALHEAIPDAQMWTRGHTQLGALVARCLQGGGDSQDAANSCEERRPAAVDSGSKASPPGRGAATPAVGSSYYDLLATRAGVKRLEDTMDLAAEVKAGTKAGGEWGADSSGAGSGSSADGSANAQSGGTYSPVPPSDQERGYAAPVAMPTFGGPIDGEQQAGVSWPAVAGVSAVLLAMFSGIYHIGSMAMRMFPSNQPEGGVAGGGQGVWELVGSSVGLLLAALLLVSGIGILRRVEWGVAGMYCWSGLALLWALISVGGAIWLHGFLGAPLTLATQLSPQSPEIARRLAVLLLVFGTAWRLGWPLAAIFWLRRPGVRADIAKWDAATAE